MVRPWNPCSIATTCVRPVRRVSLKAASLASVPELEKNTLPDPWAPSSASSFSASSTCGAVAKKFDVCPSVPSCVLTASTSAGWAWPNEFTAMPPRKSRYSLPSTSHTREPSPRASTSLGAPNVFIRERSEEHTSELQPLMRNSDAGFCLKKKTEQDTRNFRHRQ